MQDIERNLCWQGKAMLSVVSDLKLYLKMFNTAISFIIYGMIFSLEEGGGWASLLITFSFRGYLFEHFCYFSFKNPYYIVLQVKLVDLIIWWPKSMPEVL